MGRQSSRQNLVQTPDSSREKLTGREGDCRGSGAHVVSFLRSSSVWGSAIGPVRSAFRSGFGLGVNRFVPLILGAKIGKHTVRLSVTAVTMRLRSR